MRTSREDLPEEPGFCEAKLPDGLTSRDPAAVRAFARARVAATLAANPEYGIMNVLYTRIDYAAAVERLLLRFHAVTLGITHVEPPGKDASGVQGPSLDERIRVANDGNPYRVKMRIGGSRRRR